MDGIHLIIPGHPNRYVNIILDVLLVSSDFRARAPCAYSSVYDV
jgi:hypothetical protein